MRCKADHLTCAMQWVGVFGRFKEDGEPRTEANAADRVAPCGVAGQELNGGEGADSDN